MTSENPTGRPLPRDLQARHRLQEAQRAEAGAVAEVYRAEASLARARAHYDAVVARAGQRIAHADAEVAQARAVLVTISGRDRAAQLLGIERTELPRTPAIRNRGNDQ